MRSGPNPRFEARSHLVDGSQAVALLGNSTSGCGSTAQFISARDGPRFTCWRNVQCATPVEIHP